MGKISDLVYPELQTTQRLSFVGDNFLTWKLKIAFVLADHGFPHLINPSPEDPTWNDQNPEALWLILRSLDNFLQSEFEKHTPASIMGTLLTRFDSLSKRFPGISLRPYMYHRMESGTHINQHIFPMRAMAKELEHGRGVKIPDEVQAMFLLKSLPEDWAEDVAGLLRDLDGREEDLSFVSFSRKLRVLQDVKELTNFVHGEKLRKRVCKNCGKPGHYQSDCPDQELTTWDQSFSLYGRGIFQKSSNPIKLTMCSKSLKPSDPADSASEEDARRFKKWHADDFTCRHLILGTLDDDIFLSFCDYPTAKSLMDAIDTFFSTSSAAQKLVRLKRYTNHRMAEGTPIFNHLHEMDRMVLNLKDSGMCIPSEMQSAFLIDSLPGSWNQTVSSLEFNMSMDKENSGWNIDNVWKRVRDAGRLKEMFEKTEADDSRPHDNANGGWKNKRVLRECNCRQKKPLYCTPLIYDVFRSEILKQWTKSRVSTVVYPELLTTQKLSWTGDNFLIWKLKFAFVLTDHQFHRPLSGGPNLERPDLLLEFGKYRDALWLVLRSLDEDLLVEFGKYTTPASIMAALLDRSNSRLKDFTGINIRLCKNYRMAPGTHINQHIFRIRAMATELEFGAGVKIPDDVLQNRKILYSVLTFLCSEPTLSEILYPGLKNRFRIDYKGSNFFAVWKREIFDVLKENKVDYVLKEPEPSDPSESTSEEYISRMKKWRADDFTCRHLILGTMEDDVFLSFYGFPTAKSLMDAIEAFFNSASAAQKLVGLRRYVNHQMAAETPTISHLTNMDRLVAKLKNSGLCLPSEMQSVFLLDSLPV
ncbi:OLC1v1006285C1 [Oldenlandia corymbosa var. corymbosa]|uniref:OLC1v1006285C1 n=1 Tax=Oldenlandia corymbosa var. corymbosa TaxID=529605 RepID=A0AAV1DGQ3_OLDCO|nr:OLC1v1006285C1 [Oldenlandia corymbosa var. corymbosa]